MTVMFDTLKLAQDLRDEAGFTPQQAEGLATALGRSASESIATKADIAEVKTEIAGLRAELKTDIAEVRTEMQQIKADLLKWFVAIMSGQAIFIITMIKLL